MKRLRCLIQAMGAVACGALVLSLLGGDAMAGKSPPGLWPQHAVLLASAHYAPGSGPYAYISVAWPIANGADHYRLTAGGNKKWSSPLLVPNPTAYSINSDGLAYREFYVPSVQTTYWITVTAYSGPDESVAYSESLYARVDITFPIGP
jgi:hypothetical protein